MSDQKTVEANDQLTAGVRIHPADRAKAEEKKRDDFYAALREAQAALELAALYQIKPEALPEKLLPYIARFSCIGQTPLTLKGVDGSVMFVTSEEVRANAGLTMQAAMDIITVAAANPAARAGAVTPFGTEKDRVFLTLAARQMGLKVADAPSDEVIAQYQAEWTPFINSYQKDAPAPVKDNTLSAKANARFRGAPVIDENLYQQGLDYVFHVATQVQDKGLAPQITVRDTAQALNIGEGKARALLDKIESHETLITRGPGRRRYVQNAPSP